VLSFRTLTLIPVFIGTHSMKFPYAISAVLEHYHYLSPQQITERIRFSSFVSIPCRYMYFAVPKAACSAMRWLLHDLEGGGPLPFPGAGGRGTGIHNRANISLPSLVDLDDDTQKHVLQSPDFLRMIIVRNPYDRLISSWRHKIALCEPGAEEIYLQIKGRTPRDDINLSVSLEEFVKWLATNDMRTTDQHWRRQTDHAFFTALNFSWVGKVERMDETLQQFQLHLGHPEPLQLRKINISVKLDYGVIDDRLAKMISKLYQPDFDVLDYDPNTWPSTAAQPETSVPVESFRREIMQRNLRISYFASQALKRGVPSGSGH
jgi:Sulfotransferase family